jgi:hypothetical protein
MRTKFFLSALAVLSLNGAFAADVPASKPVIAHLKKPMLFPTTLTSNGGRFKVEMVGSDGYEYKATTIGANLSSERVPFQVYERCNVKGCQKVSMFSVDPQNIKRIGTKGVLLSKSIPTPLPSVNKDSGKGSDAVLPFVFISEKSDIALVKPVAIVGTALAEGIEKNMKAADVMHKAYFVTDVAFDSKHQPKAKTIMLKRSDGRCSYQLGVEGIKFTKPYRSRISFNVIAKSCNGEPFKRQKGAIFGPDGIEGVLAGVTNNHIDPIEKGNVVTVVELDKNQSL